MSASDLISAQVEVSWAAERSARHLFEDRTMSIQWFVRGRKPRQEDVGKLLFPGSLRGGVS